uniref:G0/G1 switch 2 n=1 Tax=Oreochromis niloticus TaxID=8128 RepID=A0A669DUJ7_ORENI
MENFGEIIPFAKEMLTQRPSRSMLKIYMLGSTLAMLGMVGGLVEMAFLPFVERDTEEDEPEKAKYLLTSRRRSSANRLHAS